jgi:peptidyl-prolyl cis-trans isomerase C
MRFSGIALILCGFAFAQAPQTPDQAKVPDDTVVATTPDGRKYTAGEVRAMVAGLPPQYQQAYSVNPAVGLQQLIMTKYLAEEARKKGIDKESPTKEQLQFQTDSTLASLAVSHYSMQLFFSAEEQQKYYEAHADRFKQAKVRVIYVAFSAGALKSETKTPAEAEAKTKIEDLRKQLLAGADFGKLAKENSDDKESAGKGGEWGMIKRSAKLPDPVMKVIFELKVGAVSEPVKQPNGFYLLKVDEFSKQDYEDVASQISDQMKQEKFAAWLVEMNQRFKIKVENSNFFPRAQPPAPASR